VNLTVAAIGQRHAPIARQRAEHVLEGVGGANRSARKTDDFVIHAQAPPKGVAIFENVGDDNVAGVRGDDLSAQRGMIDQPAAAQIAKEILDLIDGDRLTDADVDAAAFFK
jgi:hypothetical protein